MQSHTQVQFDFQLPTLEQVKQAIVKIMVDYKKLESEKQKSNAARNNIINLLDHMIQDENLLGSNDAVEILLGTMVFATEQISGEKKYYFSKFHSAQSSDLYKLVNSAFTELKVKLTDEDKLILVSSQYHYLKDRAPKNLTANTTWMVNDSLQKAILSVIRKQIGRIKVQIQALLTAMPDYTQIEKNLLKVVDDYKKSNHKGHQKHADFLLVINDYCKQLPSPEENELSPANMVLGPNLLRIAAMIAVLKAIEDERWTSYTTPGTPLYTGLCKVLNKSSTEDFKYDDKVVWLGFLEQNIDAILEHRKEFIAQEEKDRNPNVKADLARFSKMIHENCKEYKKLLSTSSAMHNNMVLATSTAAQAGMSSVVQGWVGDIIPNPAVIVMDAAATAAGAALGWPMATVAAVRLARYAIPFMIAGVYAGALDSAGTTVAETAVSAVETPFRYSARGVKSLIDWYTHVEFDKDALYKNTKLMQVFMSLPEDAFPSEMKAKLENNFGARPASRP
jgi:hypothetical protein